jgi:type IV pilus assembly protein PilA
VNFKNLELEYIVSLWLRDRRFDKAQTPEGHGFTLIELLVVIVIIGLLAAISLPTFLTQANKARFAEAKSFVGTMSRLQQAYYLEKRIFADDITRLNLGANTSSANFTYSVLPGSVTGTPLPQDLNAIITNVATPQSPNLKAFVGVVGIPGVVRIDTVFCIADAPNIVIFPGSLNVTAQTMVCPINFTAE